MMRIKSHVLALTATLLIVSCWNPFAPSEGLLEGGLDLTLTEQRTPEEVLQNFRYAYIYRDSLVYSELFDTSFIFLYYDPDLGGGTGGYSYWGLDTELRTTSSLFRTFDHFTLVWNATIATDTSQSGTISLTKTFDLTIGGELIYGNAVFDFREDSTENIWRISRWEDESFY